MSQVILIGVDSSSCCQRAVEFASQAASAASAEILVCHVIEWSPYSFSTAMENEVRHKRREEELERANEHIVSPVVESLREAGLRAEGLIRHGHPAQTLAQLAAEKGASSIIVGRTGQSSLKSHLFGSVPSSLVQVAECPVTVVP